MPKSKPPYPAEFDQRIIERNPAADVKPGDALKPRKKTHYARSCAPAS